MRKLGALLALLAVASCGRTDFLYRVQDVNPRSFEAVHKLKELQGETQVDILWVIDNSGSMDSYQKDLIKNADTFITDFVSKGGLEWKMGILSSSLREPPYIGFTTSTPLQWNTPDNVNLFKNAVKSLGTNGDVTERFFAPIMTHVPAHPTFIRPAATLAIIFLTDAPEQSRIPAPTFLNFLKSTKVDLKRVVTYGVFAANDFGCQFTDEYWKYVGSPYEEVIKATNGKVYKLCNTDFGKNLADLGKDLVQRIKRPFVQLRDRPLISSLRVSHKGKELQGGPIESGGKWIYDFDLNRVVFHNLDFAPGDNEEVTIGYQIADAIPR
jgi:hypothetical protein